MGEGEGILNLAEPFPVPGVNPRPRVPEPFCAVHHRRLGIHWTLSEDTGWRCEECWSGAMDPNPPLARVVSLDAYRVARSEENACAIP
jgi:hypothetical protein